MLTARKAILVVELMYDPSVGETLTTLQLIVESLDSLQIPYFIGGSIASGAHGLFRATNDIDVVLDLKQQQVQPLAASFAPRFYVDELSMQTAFQEQSSFNIIDQQSFVKVDFFSKLGPLEVNEFGRARETLSLSGKLRARIATPEYIILAKLRWWELGGRVSDRQIEDAKGVVLAQGDSLDTGYLHHWAMELQLEAELNQLLSVHTS